MDNPPIRSITRSIKNKTDVDVTIHYQENDSSSEFRSFNLKGGKSREIKVGVSSHISFVINKNSDNDKKYLIVELKTGFIQKDDQGGLGDSDIEIKFGNSNGPPFQE